MGQVGANQARVDTLNSVAGQGASLASEYRLTLGHQVCRASTEGEEYRLGGWLVRNYH